MSERVALVTGANRGIGHEVVRQLRERGYNVLLGARSLAEGEQAATELGGPTIVPIQLDVTDETSVEAARQRVEDD